MYTITLEEAQRRFPAGSRARVVRKDPTARHCYPVGAIVDVVQANSLVATDGVHVIVECITWAEPVYPDWSGGTLVPQSLLPTDLEPVGADEPAAPIRQAYRLASDLEHLDAPAE